MTEHLDTENVFEIFDIASKTRARIMHWSLEPSSVFADSEMMANHEIPPAGSGNSMHGAGTATKESPGV